MLGIPGLTGPRALAFPATVGVAGGADAVYVNPAAIAARRIYVVDTHFFMDQRQGEQSQIFFGGTVVDSQSGSWAAGMTYDRAQQGPYTGNMWRGTVAGQVGQGFFVGAEAVYDNLKGPSSVLAVTADAGVFWQVARYFSLGAAGYNLIPVGHQDVFPMGTAAGLSIGSDTGFQVAGEWRASFPKGAPTANQYRGGLELLLGDLLPVRGGYVYDQASRTSWWTAGIGLVTRNVALDAGYQQAFSDRNARTFAVAIRAFPFQ